MNETQLELIVGRVGQLCMQDLQDVFLLRKKKNNNFLLNGYLLTWRTKPE